MTSVRLVVQSTEAGERLDSFLAEHISYLSRTQSAGLARDGKVLVNGSPVKPSRRMEAGDLIEARIDLPPALTASPEHLPLVILYEDDDMVVIDKPAGMVVHPAPGNERGTLANALASRYPASQGVGGAERPGIVHRLDKDTSGVMVAALSQAGMISLQRQIATRAADRHYLALASGHLDQTEGTVDAPIGRDPVDRKRMAVFGVAARPARTSYSVRERLPGFDLVEAKLQTGRTHQIRVHLAALGHPVAGDSVYHGAPVAGLRRQFLHAHRLRIRRPHDGELLSFTSPLPDDLQVVLNRLHLET